MMINLKPEHRRRGDRDRDTDVTPNRLLRARAPGRDHATGRLTNRLGLASAATAAAPAALRLTGKGKLP